MALDPELNEFVTASPKNVLYTFKEIAEGTGIIDYYVHETGNAGVGAYALLTTQHQDWSLGAEYHYANMGNATLTFTSLAFTDARIMEGTAYIYFYHKLHPTSTAGDGRGTITITIKKNTDTIATIASNELDCPPNWNGQGEKCFMTIAIPRTDFAVGDTVVITAAGVKTGNCNYDMTLNPLDTAVTIAGVHASAGGPTTTVAAGTPTYFKASLPFRTDIQ